MDYETIATLVEALVPTAKEAFNEAVTLPGLRAASAAVLGKDGAINPILKSLGELNADQRQDLGRRINEAVDEIHKAFEIVFKAISRRIEDSEQEASFKGTVDDALFWKMRASKFEKALRTIAVMLNPSLEGCDYDPAQAAVNEVRHMRDSRPL